MKYTDTKVEYGTEIIKVYLALTALDYKVKFNKLYDGFQIVCPEKDWDVICHSGSYGHEDSLLEGMGGPFANEYDSVQGYLTAAETVRMILNYSA